MNSYEILLCVVVGVALVSFVVSTPMVLGPLAFRFIDWRKSYYAERLDILHLFGDVPMHYVCYECVCMLATMVVLYLVVGVPLVMILGGLFGAAIPSVLIKRKIQERRSRLECQFPDALLSLASSVKAGLSLSQALEQAADQLPNPVGQEFTYMVRQYNTGTPLDDVLRTTQERLRSKHFSLIANALIINRERGGDITEILERISTSLREIYRLEEKFRTETAGPRFEGRIMLGVPVFVLYAFYTVQPELVLNLFYKPVGIVIVIVAGLMMTIAYLWIAKIVEEEP